MKLCQIRVNPNDSEQIKVTEQSKLNFFLQKTHKMLEIVHHNYDCDEVH